MKRWGWLLRWGGTAAGIGYVVHVVDFAKAREAFSRISLAAIVLAIGLVALNVVAGAARWRALLVAYGANSRPSLPRATALYFISFFYNNYLPGAVAGDVGRGVVTRDAFTGEGATGALAVVLVERALGLFGLFALLAAGLIATRGALDSQVLWWWTVLGGLGSFALVAMIPLARKLGPHLPARLARVAGKLPALHDGRAFAAAVALSVATQALIALAGSLLVVPLAAATTFLPITVGGAGAREAVYVALCGRLFGMPEADALAASLGLWLAHLIVGAAGGAAQLARRRALT
jgi:uncharacterized membrane protein YbhN (UPF0104 family)